MAEPAPEQHYYTREEYLAREEIAEYKSEYYDGEIVAMAGGSQNHSIISCNIIRRSSEALDEKDCLVFDSNMKLDIPKYNLFVYPDVMVACGKLEYSKGRTDIIKNPILVIEVLSPSTEQGDRMKKFAYYQTMPSIQEYVLVWQDEPRVEVYFKQGEKSWLYTVADGLDAAILFRSIDHEFALKDVYQKIDWEQETP